MKNNNNSCYFKATLLTMLIRFISFQIASVLQNLFTTEAPGYAGICDVKEII